MIAAIDFDGTIIEDDCYPGIGPERPYAIDVLRALQAHGHTLILWTCREGDELADAVRFLAERGVLPDAVNANAHGFERFGRKPYADLYIDDRAFPQGPVTWRLIDQWFIDHGWYGRDTGTDG